MKIQINRKKEDDNFLLHIYTVNENIFKIVLWHKINKKIEKVKFFHRFSKAEKFFKYLIFKFNIGAEFLLKKLLLENNDLSNFKRIEILYDDDYYITFNVKNGRLSKIDKLANQHNDDLSEYYFTELDAWDISNIIEKYQEFLEKFYIPHDFDHHGNSYSETSFLDYDTHKEFSKNSMHSYKKEDDSIIVKNKDNNDLYIKFYLK